jgi:predicted site-specific integrase-resolvase
VGAVKAGELSRLAGVSTATISYHIQRGTIRAERQADGSYQIDEGEVERVVASYGRTREPERPMPPAYFGNPFWQPGDGW